MRIVDLEEYDELVAGNLRLNGHLPRSRRRDPDRAPVWLEVAVIGVLVGILAAVWIL